jgi:hypothetical protein
MDAKQLAETLNGRQYRDEITSEEATAAALTGLVVVFGGSDDLMYFSGAISDELCAYDGTTESVNSDGLVKNKCEDEECPYFLEQLKTGVEIKQLWCNEEGYSWTYETAIPHETFEILEDDEPYCRGIVFALSDVGK